MAALLPCAAAGAQATRRDNVLLIVADDVGVDNVAAYAEGGNPPPTPNLDALARSGILFRNVWANSMCSPTRAAIMTGRHAFRTGVGFVIPGNELQRGEITLPEHLDGQASGYAHAAIGKWHVSNPSSGYTAPNDAGWSHFAGFVFGFGDYWSWQRTVNGTTQLSTEYATTRMVDDALAWIQGQTGPWFCYLAVASAHSPYHAPPAHLHTQNLSGLDPQTDPVPFYRAMVEAMDTEIGRLLSSLGPQLSRTNVIFIGDNGTSPEVTVPPFVPEHGKGSPYEGGLRVPMIVAGPAVASPGREVTALVGAVDLFATVSELAGVDPVPLFAATDSVSFAPYLGDPGRTPLRQMVYSELFTNPATGFSCARNDRYKLVEVRVGGRTGYGLFDLVNDPFETTVLNVGALTTEQQTNFAQLFQELTRVRTSTPGFTGYGPPGCQGSNGAPAIGAAGSPRVGGSYQVTLGWAAPSSPALLLIGGSDQRFGALRLPFALAALGGGPGCHLVASGELLGAHVTDALGTATSRLNLPNHPWWLGARLHHQWLVLDPAAPNNPLGVVGTSGLRAEIGQ